MESTFSFNRKSCDGAGVSLCKGFLLAAVSASEEVQDEMNELIATGYVTATYDDNMKPDGFQLSYKGSSALATIIADSDKEAKPDECYETLAKELKDIYPKGKKPRTGCGDAGGVRQQAVGLDRPAGRTLPGRVS